MKKIFLSLLFSFCFAPLLSFADKTDADSQKEKTQAEAKNHAEQVQKAIVAARDFYRQKADANGAMRILDSVSGATVSDKKLELKWKLEKSAYFNSFAEADAFLSALLAEKKFSSEERYMIYGKRVESIRRYRESDVSAASVWEQAASDPLLEKKEQMNVMLARAELLSPEKRALFLQGFTPDDSLPSSLTGNYYLALGYAWRQRVNYYTEPLAASFYGKAVSAFRKAAEYDRSPKKLIPLAENQFLAGDYAGAEDTIGILLPMNLSEGNRLSVECLRGKIALKRGDHQAAYTILQKALNPQAQASVRTSHENYAALAEAAFALEKYPEALSAVELARKAGLRHYYEPYVEHLEKLVSERKAR